MNAVVRPVGRGASFFARRGTLNIPDKACINTKILLQFRFFVPFVVNYKVFVRITTRLNPNPNPNPNPRLLYPKARKPSPASPLKVIDGEKKANVLNSKYLSVLYASGLFGGVENTVTATTVNRYSRNVVCYLGSQTMRRKTREVEGTRENSW